MPLVIGVDEAGYGPNLGPLVVTAVVCEVPGAPKRTAFWDKFAGVISQTHCRDGSRLHVADSKQVHDPAVGVGPLEVGVLTALRVAGVPAETLRQLRDEIVVCEVTRSVSEGASIDGLEPWFDGTDLPLPHAADPDAIATFAARWSEACDRTGIRIEAIRSDVVFTPRFNRLTRAHDNKGLTLSRITLSLLSGVWDAEHAEPVLVICDKHGGRNRYDELLSEVAGDHFVIRQEEGGERSRYKLGDTEVRFQTRAEAHFPVALASMVSKYLRELAMVLFNQFWQRHLPEVRPTKGYPRDSHRFRAEIAETQRRLGIADDVLWRER